MARARNIKPGFFKNYELADLGAQAQILFAGLWCLADREGRLEDKPRFIKAEIFPYYEYDVNSGLTELQRLKLVSRYQVNGVCVIQVCNFKKHQTPHNTEKASILPEQPIKHSIESTTYAANGELTVDSRKSNGGKTPDSGFSDSPIPDSGLMDTAAQAPLPIQKKSADRKTGIPENFGISDRVRDWAAKGGYTMLDQHLESFTRKCNAKGYKNISWDDAFMEAIREDWAKLRGRVANGSAPPASHESADELESRAAVEKQAFSKGLHAWDALQEQWPVYKARVLRAPRLPGMSLDRLTEMALKRERVAA